MKPIRIVSCALPILLMLSGCASHDYDYEDRNQFVTEFYAQVEQVYPVEFESEVGRTAVTWGLWGALENSHGNRSQILGGAIAGALIGGVITSLFEGSNKGYEYYLRATDGDQVVVVLDHYPADVGECVRVRMSSTVKVYSTIEPNCSNESNEVPNTL